jgi:hypothetical protein
VAHVEPENVNPFVDQASQRFRPVRRRAKRADELRLPHRGLISLTLALG